MRSFCYRFVNMLGRRRDCTDCLKSCRHCNQYANSLCCLCDGYAAFNFQFVDSKYLRFWGGTFALFRNQIATHHFPADLWVFVIFRCGWLFGVVSIRWVICGILWFGLRSSPAIHDYSVEDTLNGFMKKCILWCGKLCPIALLSCISAASLFR